MSLSTPFIRRPVATTLLTLGVLAAGAVAFFQLPVSPLPKVDYPTISVRAQLPGASPDVVATSVATPLERHLGQKSPLKLERRQNNLAVNGGLHYAPSFR